VLVGPQSLHFRRSSQVLPLKYVASLGEQSKPIKVSNALTKRLVRKLPIIVESLGAKQTQPKQPKPFDETGSEGGSPALSNFYNFYE